MTFIPAACNNGHPRTPENTYSSGSCAPCHRASSMRWLSRNREARASYQRRKYRMNWYEAIERLGGCCIDCGYKDNLNALQFDHREPSDKVANLTTLFRNGFTKAAEDELKKCELRCANCHAIRTALYNHKGYTNAVYT